MKLKRDRHLRDDEKIYLFVAGNATRSKLTLHVCSIVLLF